MTITLANNVGYLVGVVIKLATGLLLLGLLMGYVLRLLIAMSVLGGEWVVCTTLQGNGIHSNGLLLPVTGRFGIVVLKVFMVDNVELMITLLPASTLGLCLGDRAWGRRRSSEAGGVEGILGLSLIHISEPTRLLSISYAVFCLKKKNTQII
eukprot:TRINITY_DN52246_c0_g1_i1.p1 TRINITY_DN52246_c0_g1~~TRINITY_DN52246_c0_g1_i1.p1  ORF type:complete len:152 (+),score=22.54 TRINITY_DN52246_c0_g1_i1:540-995(+)